MTTLRTLSEDWAMATGTCTKIWRSFAVWFLSYVFEQINRQTDRHIYYNTLYPSQRRSNYKPVKPSCCIFSWQINTIPTYAHYNNIPIYSKPPRWASNIKKLSLTHSIIVLCYTAVSVFRSVTSRLVFGSDFLRLILHCVMRIFR